MNTVMYCDPFVPAEWIAAHGLRPDRAMPQAVSSDPHARVILGMCPYARAFMNATAGSTASAAVFTTTCDQMRRSAEMILRDSPKPIFLMNGPTIWQRSAGMELYVSELYRLSDFLVRLGGRKPSERELAAVMVEFEEQRQKREAEKSVQTGAIPLALVGGPLMQPGFAIFELVAAYGGAIVLDGTTGGERTQPARFDRRNLASSPLRELANAYFGSIPDVFLRPNDRLYEWLEDRMAAMAVRGLIFHRYLWCDKWHAELGRMKELLDIPILALDAGDGDQASESRLETQVQAFMEMLK